jgi:hypothetical protein
LQRRWFQGEDGKTATTQRALRFWMTDHEHESEHKRTGPEEPYPAEKARQGEIILRTRTRQIIFISGLVGLVILVIILRLAL